MGILQWFKNSSKMKRWIFLILIGVVFTSMGIAKIMVSNDSISFRYIEDFCKYLNCSIDELINVNIKKDA